MPEPPPSSCVSSRKFGEEAAVTTTSSALPTAYLVEDAAGEVVAVSVAQELTHEGAARYPDPQPAAQVPHRSGRWWWFVIVLGWLFVSTALSQASVAMAVRGQGIEVIDYFIGETFYPRAGNPWIGFLNLVTAVLFLAVSGYQLRTCCSGCFEFLALSVCFVSFCWSFGEREVYNALKDFDQCVDAVNGDYTLDWGGDCYCWDYEVGGAPAVNVDASTSCENVLDYVESILASYVLMTILMAFSIVAVLVRFSVSQHELSTPYRR